MRLITQPCSPIAELVIADLTCVKYLTDWAFRFFYVRRVRRYRSDTIAAVIFDRVSSSGTPPNRSFFIRHKIIYGAKTATLKLNGSLWYDPDHNTRTDTLKLE